MSLLPTERLAIALTPTQVGVVHRRVGWRRRETSGTVLPVATTDKAPWEEAVTTLDRWLAERKPGRMGANLVLANRFFRFALVPWAAGVGGAEEEAALALACFEPRYGDMSEWTVRLEEGAYGEARIACAVETSLIEAVRQVFERHRLRCRAVRPAFAAAWNRQRQAVERTLDGRDGIYAMTEPGSVVMACRRGGRWLGLRAASLATDSSLRELVEREALLQGFADAPVAWVTGCGLASEAVESAAPNRIVLHLTDLGAAEEQAVSLALLEVMP